MGLAFVLQVILFTIFEPIDNFLNNQNEVLSRFSFSIFRLLLLSLRLHCGFLCAYAKFTGCTDARNTYNVQNAKIYKILKYVNVREV